MVHGASKTIQHQLSPGNANGGTKVRALLPDSALVLGSWSKGLGNMVQEPQARFHVAKWGVICH